MQLPREIFPAAWCSLDTTATIVYRKAFGSRSLEPTREPMTVDTIFDMASLTKCIATTTSVMQLISEGRVRLNDPVAAYLPEFKQNGKEDITVRELMTHFSGSPPDLDLKSPWQGRDTSIRDGNGVEAHVSTRHALPLQRHQFRDPRLPGREGHRENSERICKQQRCLRRWA